MAPTVVVIGNTAYLGTLDEEANRIVDCIQVVGSTNVSEANLRALIKARNTGKAATVQMPKKDAQYSACPLDAELTLKWDALESQMKLIKATAISRLENQYFDSVL